MSTAYYQHKFLAENNPELVFYKGFKLGTNREIQPGEKHYVEESWPIKIFAGGYSKANQKAAENVTKITIAKAIISALVLHDKGIVNGQHLIGGLITGIDSKVEFQFTQDLRLMGKGIYHNGGEIWFTDEEIHVILYD